MTRARTAATSTIRPKTWASGRNSRVEGSSADPDPDPEPSPDLAPDLAPAPNRNTDSHRATSVSASYMKFPCVSTHPLGRPVVPEV